MNKPYPLPDPRVRPDSFLTILYKTLKCIEYDDRVWDKEFFARANKRTAYLLEIFNGDVQLAARCMQELKERFEADFDGKWTIETVCTYAFEWKAQQQKNTDRDCLRRLIGDYAKEARMGDLKRIDVGSLLERMKELPPPEQAPEPAAKQAKGY